MSNRELTMSVLMTTTMMNIAGNIHGGDLLFILDQVAYTCAVRYAKTNVVTLSVDQVRFGQPIYVGELVTFFSTINYVGKSSMEVGVKVVAENIFTDVKRHTNSCFFTMVAVTEGNKPTKIPSFSPSTEIEKLRYECALARKEARIAVEKQNKAMVEQVFSKLKPVQA